MPVMRQLLSGLCFVWFAFWAAHAVDSGGVDPVGQTLKLLEELRINADSDASSQDEAYKKYQDWCASVTSELQNEVAVGRKASTKLEADIYEAGASIEASVSAIEKLATEVVRDEAKQNMLRDVREREEKEFLDSAKALEDAISMLDRAGEVLSDELSKNSSSDSTMLLQEASPAVTSHISEVFMGLASLVDSAGLASRNRAQLAALLQSHMQEEDEGGGAPAPAPAAATGVVSKYGPHTQDFVDLLKQMQDEAEGNLQATQNKNKEAKADFQLLTSALERQMAAGNTNIAAEKKNQRAQVALKAKLEGDRAQSRLEMEAVNVTLVAAQDACMQASTDQDKARAGRKQEMQALDELLHMLKSSVSLSDTEAGVEQPPSMLQLVSKAAASMVSGLAATSKTHRSPTEVAAKFLAARKARQDGDHMRNSLSGDMVIGLLKRLGKQQHSTVFAQLTSRIAAVLRSNSGEDPLMTVRQLIQDLILKMQEQTDGEQQEEAYCKQEISRSTERIRVLDTTIRTSQTNIDLAAAQAGILKSDVDTTQEELARLAKEQVSMASAREYFQTVFKTERAHRQSGLEGVHAAIDRLGEFYGQAEPGALLQQAKSIPVQTNERSQAIGLMAASMGLDAGIGLQEPEEDNAADREAAAAESAQAGTEQALNEVELGSTAPHAVSALQESNTYEAAIPPAAPVPMAATGQGLTQRLQSLENLLAENLARLDTQESDQEVQHQEILKKNNVIQELKQKNMERKAKESKNFDMEVKKLNADLESAKRELKPLIQYHEQVKERCAKMMHRDEIMRRRKEEIEGLQETLAVLEGQASLAQVKSRSFLQQRSEHKRRSELQL